MTAELLKKTAKDLGADLCGTASIDRFKDAPAGFHPKDILPGTRSVIVLAKRLPESVFLSPGPVPYTFASETTLQEVHRITCELAIALQDRGILAVPVPSEPYEYWDEEKQEGRGILSLKHAGHLAGLGVMGRNTLLVNERFGNRITLSALLTEGEFENDPILHGAYCPEQCTLCMDHCPGRALDGVTALQMACRGKSIRTNAKGYTLYTCRECMAVCPQGRGISRRA